MAKDDRIYLAIPPAEEPVFVEEFGHKYEIAGVLFSGESERQLLLLLPGRHGSINNPLVVDATPEQWAWIINFSDDPVYLTDHPEGKIMHRKAERQVSGFVQQSIWARDGFKCMYCGRKMGEVQLSIDHVIPLELGGKNDSSNYLSACKKCNKDKGSMPPQDFCAKIGLVYDDLVAYLSGFSNPKGK